MRHFDPPQRGFHSGTGVADIMEGMRLGEQVAINMLREMVPCYNEHFSGFSLTTFDGQRLVILPPRHDKPRPWNDHADPSIEDEAGPTKDKGPILN